MVLIRHIILLVAVAPAMLVGLDFSRHTHERGREKGCRIGKDAYMCVQAISGGRGYYLRKGETAWETIAPFSCLVGGNSKADSRTKQIQVDEGDEFYLDRTAKATVLPLFVQSGKKLGQSEILGIQCHERIVWEIPQGARPFSDAEFAASHLEMRLMGRSKGVESTRPPAIIFPGVQDEVELPLEVVLRTERKPTTIAYWVGPKLLGPFEVGTGDQIVSHLLTKGEMGRFVDAEGGSEVRIRVTFPEGETEQRIIHIRKNGLRPSTSPCVAKVLDLMNHAGGWPEASSTVSEALEASGSSSAFCSELRHQIHGTSLPRQTLQRLKNHPVGVVLEDIGNELGMSEFEMWRLLEKPPL